MKKKLCRITALLLAAVLSLGGCGQPGAGKKRTDSTQQTEETKNKKEDQSKSDKKGPEYRPCAPQSYRLNTVHS